MNVNTYMVFFALSGIFLIALHKMKYACPPARIEYRHIKRDFEDIQRDENELNYGIYERNEVPRPQGNNQGGTGTVNTQSANTQPFGSELSAQTA